MSTWQVDVDDMIPGFQHHLGRPVVALDGVLRIMSENLQRTLMYFNFPERVWPKGYHYAGERLGDPDTDKWPKLLIGGSFQTSELGSGHQDDNHVMLTCAYGPQFGRREFQDAFDVVTVARGILRHPNFAGPFYDPEHPERRLWNHILPTRFDVVPENWTLYSGWIAAFRLVQTPGSSLWPIE